MRRLYGRDHLDHVLGTFGLILFFNELIAIVWGRAALYASGPGARIRRSNPLAVARVEHDDLVALVKVLAQLERGDCGDEPGVEVFGAASVSSPVALSDTRSPPGARRILSRACSRRKAPASSRAAGASRGRAWGRRCTSRSTSPLPVACNQHQDFGCGR